MVNLLQNDNIGIEILIIPLQQLCLDLLNENSNVY